MDRKIVVMYSKRGLTMREIARQLGSNHKMISRVLKRNDVCARRPKNLRGKRKFPCDIELKYNNMVTHLRFDVSIKWAMQFKDFEKIKTLNDLITNRGGRYNESTEWYMKYIEKFYNDRNFNKFYNRWKETKDVFMKPSIDHIKPRSKGGDNSLDNLQIISWFENKMKKASSLDEWNQKKKRVLEYLT